MALDRECPNCGRPLLTFERIYCLDCQKLYEYWAFNHGKRLPVNEDALKQHRTRYKITIDDISNGEL